MVKKPRLTQDVRRRILQRAAKRAALGEKAIVLTLDKDGSPSRVYGLAEYLRKSQIARKVRPWTHRRKIETVPDPLGAKPGRIVASLSRSEIYD